MDYLVGGELLMDYLIGMNGWSDQLEKSRCVYDLGPQGYTHRRSLA